MNLNLMIEVTLSGSDVNQVRKVVRVPNHVCVMTRLAERCELLEEIRTSKCLLFLGAGFSFPARLPSWLDLLARAAELAEAAVSQDENGPDWTFDVSASPETWVTSEVVKGHKVNIQVLRLGRSGVQVCHTLCHSLFQAPSVIPLTTSSCPSPTRS